MMSRTDAVGPRTVPVRGTRLWTDGFVPNAGVQTYYSVNAPGNGGSIQKGLAQEAANQKGYSTNSNIFLHRAIELRRHPLAGAPNSDSAAILILVGRVTPCAPWRKNQVEGRAFPGANAARTE